MAEIITMPKMSDTMEEGVIASWLVKVGDTVKSGDILAEVETDKATMELESYNDGILLHIGPQEGEAVPIDGVLAIIGEKGEDISSLLESASAPQTASAETKAETISNESPEPAQAVDTSGIDATVITMPKMSDTMEEGTIASWLVKVGDAVKSGDVLAEIETDKATMEFESYFDGTVLYIGPKEGDSIAVDEIIAVIGANGADYETLIKAHKSESGSAAQAPEPAVVAQEAIPAATANVSAAQATPTPVEVPASSNGNGRLKASPLAKRLASEKGYDIAQIKGSGDQGRIIKRDVENFVPSATPTVTPDSAVSAAPAPIELPSVVGEEQYEEMNVSQMRKTIAKRLAESKFTSPHFYLTMEINMDKAIEARVSMNEVSPVKISFNDMVIKAAASALRQNPKVNASWLGDKIRFNKHIHIGMAVAVDEGLLVPVIRFTDNKSLSHIAVETKDLGNKAKNKELQPQDWEGNTFTISNLGMFGIEEFTAIINPPDACILAIGGIKQTAVVKDGQLVPGNVMKVTLSCDHRVVDGAVGSAFLQTLKGLLEDPVRILI